MTSERRSFDLVDVTYRDQTLVVTVAELLRGEPDGWIGTPLSVQPSSERFELTFNWVTEFRSTAEPCYTTDGTDLVISEYLSECVESDYARQSCPFGGTPSGGARHFCVLTEFVIIEVLCLDSPTVRRLQAR